MFDHRNTQAAPTPTAVPSPMAQMNADRLERAPDPLLSIGGPSARIEGRFDIADSIEIECEIGGELTVGGRLVIGRHGIVRANVRTVDALIMGEYEGKMIATGEVEITETGRVSGSLQTDALVINKGGSFAGDVIELTATPALPFPSPEKRRAASSVFSRYAPESEASAPEVNDGSINDSVTIDPPREEPAEETRSGRVHQHSDTRDMGMRGSGRRHDRHGRNVRDMRDDRGNSRPDGSSSQE